tara:strand:+ start:1722 stop:2141 length:420 start_codon:yes stop_codon:yes gene_type:complete
MAITQAMCTSFKTELLGGVHDIDTDTIKIALFTSSATLGAATTAYSTTNEVVGTGYTAGGNTLTGATISAGGTTAIVDFDNTTWASSTITARGAMIYNSSKANRAIAILDFGSDKTSTDGDFTIQFPVADASNAILRIA